MNSINSFRLKISRLLHSALGNQPIFILSGPLKGWKWLPDSGNHAYWLGTYEKDYIKVFTQSLESNLVVFDVGAHTGYFTLTASRIVGNQGEVWAFEPLPRNISFIKKHLALNGCTNVKLLETAVSSHRGRAKFGSQNSFMGHLSKKGEFEVEVINLDHLMSQNDFVKPNIIKIDVEGHEYLVLKGAEKLIAQTKPILFISTHGKDNRERVLQLLESWQYLPMMVGQGTERNADYVAQPQ